MPVSSNGLVQGGVRKGLARNGTSILWFSLECRGGMVVVWLDFASMLAIKDQHTQCTN